MTKITLSKAAFEYFVKHLVELEEEKNKVLEQYFPELSKERQKLEKFIEDYIKQIDLLIQNVHLSQTADDMIPFVTIGSEVEVQDLADQEVFKYRIVSPFNQSVHEGDVSYLSPVGKALLLKKVGDELEVNAPGGIFRYKIISIHLRGDG